MIVVQVVRKFLGLFIWAVGLSLFGMGMGLCSLASWLWPLQSVNLSWRK